MVALDTARSIKYKEEPIEARGRREVTTTAVITEKSLVDWGFTLFFLYFETLFTTSQMSLFLGNLPPRIRRGELECEFRRFGRCNIQLKDGYGFAVYDFPADADNALKVLRGKNICGHSISLTWSKKQPKSFQRFRRGSRFSESFNGRSSSRRKYFKMRNEGSHYPREYQLIASQPDDEHEEPQSVDGVEKESVYHHDNGVDHEGEKHLELQNDLLNEDFSIEPNLGDNDRWGEPANVPVNEKEAEDEASFDRYEPHYGHDRRSEEYDHQRTSTHGSPTRESSRDKSQRPYVNYNYSKHSAYSNTQDKCYICGLVGHRKRNCPKAPKADGHGQEKLTRFDRHRNDNVSFSAGSKRRLRRPRSASWRNSDSIGSVKRDGRSSGLGAPHELVRKESSRISKGTHRLQIRSNSKTKKKRRKEDSDVVKNRSKAKRSCMSLRHSDSETSSSGLHSPSRKSSSSRSKSNLRSESFKERSASFRSKSISTSSISSSERSRSRSKSDSSTSLSLSDLRGQHLRSASNKAQMEDMGISSNSCLEKENNSQNKQHLFDQSQMTKGDANSDNFKVKDTDVTPLEENRSSCVIAQVEKNRDNNSQLWDEDGRYSPHRYGYEIKSSCMSQRNDTSADQNLSSENLGERTEHEVSKSEVMEDSQLPSEKQIHDVTANPPSKYSTSISLEETHKVLKHYGLVVPDENTKNSSVEAYFGSARLWPWEIIYYRRLKKGPISIENYARRVAQNEEFGMVDKYIRSSSGWYERGHS